MRSKYNILWLDDAFMKPVGIGNDIYSIKRRIEDYVKSLGYIPNIIEAKSQEDIHNILSSNPKIDIVFSDYNIDDDYKGIDFLKEIRKHYLQEMMLYSNVDESEIKQHLIYNIKSEGFELQFLSKFLFQSMSNRTVLISSMKSLIDLTLIRWQELNALRGFCLAETSQMEENGKSIFRNVIDFTTIKSILIKNRSVLSDDARRRCQELINKIDNNRFSADKLCLFDMQLMLYEEGTDDYREFNYIRTLRNGFAHIQEKTNSNMENYIELKDGTQIYEKDIKNLRIKIFDVIDKFDVYLAPYKSNSNI